ncbi:hypothetical protein [Nocardia grenadensis]|uniref:hypothetical protein n=1 Tax=Nocardia grenadensis TaxID=931537 RepID=UPI0009FFD524|nr:hypothetical protein [Nocardia grenadensis]
MLFLSAAAAVLVGLVLTDLFGFGVGGWFIVVGVVLTIASAVRRFRRSRAPLRSSRRRGVTGTAAAGGWYLGSGGGDGGSGGDSGCGGGGGGGCGGGGGGGCGGGGG